MVIPLCQKSHRCPHVIFATDLILKQNQTFHCLCNKTPVLKSESIILRLSCKHQSFPHIPLEKYSRYRWYWQVGVNLFPSSCTGSKSRSQEGYWSSCRNTHTHAHERTHTHTCTSSNYKQAQLTQTPPISIVMHFMHIFYAFPPDKVGTLYKKRNFSSTYLYWGVLVGWISLHTCNIHVTKHAIKLVSRYNIIKLNKKLCRW